MIKILLSITKLVKNKIKNLIFETTLIVIFIIVTLKFFEYFSKLCIK
jgi:hypothetical protein